MAQAFARLPALNVVLTSFGRNASSRSETCDETDSWLLFLYSQLLDCADYPV